MKLHSDARIPLTAGQSAIVTESPEDTFLIFAGFHCDFFKHKLGGERPELWLIVVDTPLSFKHVLRVYGRSPTNADFMNIFLPEFVNS